MTLSTSYFSVHACRLKSLVYGQLHEELVAVPSSQLDYLRAYFCFYSLYIFSATHALLAHTSALCHSHMPQLQYLCLFWSFMYSYKALLVCSRPSSCLINFLLNGRSVMLEMPRKAGGKMISHLLAAHGGEIFVHTLVTARSVLEDPPSISEGCGGRVTDYRITVRHVTRS
jgi:hypothetical protein